MTRGSKGTEKREEEELLLISCNWMAVGPAPADREFLFIFCRLAGPIVQQVLRTRPETQVATSSLDTSWMMIQAHDEVPSIFDIIFFARMYLIKLYSLHSKL